MLDVGNTRLKWAVFQGRELIDNGVAVDEADADLQHALRCHALNRVTIASVVNERDQFEGLLHGREVMFVDHHAELPIRNSYRTPETLGTDRLCGAIGAWSHFPSRPILLIDAGTCIKYEFVSENGVYEGGNISPGIRMRYHALHQQTSKLPLLDIEERVSGPLGKSTSEAIHLGVKQGVLFEIHGMIDTMMELHPDLKLVGTGGDLSLFVNDLKTPIFVDSLLVLRGINEVYLHNT